jgi:hypothetical protein
VARRRATLVRVWLPALALPVLFTLDGTDPDAPNTGSTIARPTIRREHRCFKIEEFWKALELEK